MPIRQFSRIIESNLLYLKVSELVNFNQLKKEVTVTNTFDKNFKVEAFSLRKDKEGTVWMGVPRHHFTWAVRDQLSDEVIDLRALGGREQYFPIITETFRPGQKELIDEFQQKLKMGMTGFLFHMPTGGGKTLTAIRAMALLGRPTLVVVPKSDLIDHWVDEIKLHTRTAPTQIGTGQNGKIDWRGKSIVIAMADTVALDREDKEFKYSWGTVIYDEAELRIPAETLNSVLSLFPAKYRIGIGATLERKDGMSQLLKLHIGETSIRTTEALKMPASVLMRRYQATKGFVPPKLDVMVRRGIILRLLEEDMARNLMIAKDVRRFLNSKGRRVIVMSDRTKLLGNVYRLLIHNLKVASEDIGYYCNSLIYGSELRPHKGGTKRFDLKRSVGKKERTHTLDNCRVILATYPMLRAGTNVPDLSGLILATPQTTAEQATGRIERYLDNKKMPIVVDYLDTRFEDCLRWADQRVEEYQSRGLKILWK
jgi:superfamily II DNA or RNA helicase